MNLYSRPVYVTRTDKDGNQREQLASVALCTTNGDLISDVQILHQFDPSVSSTEIRRVARDFHCCECDWGQNIYAGRVAA